MQDLDYTAIFTFRGKAYNEAMADFPDARENERLNLIKLLNLSAEDHFCDAPAGGGYLSDGMVKRFGQDVAVTCIEPAKEFGAMIDEAFTVINSPVTEIPVQAEQFSAFGSLAGLHHITDRSPVVAEWARVLKPGGQLAIADVPVDSKTGAFLNGFVDQHTPQGHDGVFIGHDEFSRLMAASGFDVLSEEIIEVPWIFPTREDFGAFCKKLFFLETASAAETTDAIDQGLGITQHPETGQWHMHWELLYASGRKIG